jgi:hypothetical protein
MVTAGDAAWGAGVCTLEALLQTTLHTPMHARHELVRRPPPSSQVSDRKQRRLLGGEERSNLLVCGGRPPPHLVKVRVRVEGGG